MTDAVRGFNPIWLFDDLVGNLLDDTYYFFVLQNDLPYLPATVWKDPQRSVIWSTPIEFLANGTLPNNIFYDENEVYRLEVRSGPIQDDLLIYEINDYIPNGGGGSSTSTQTTTDNQVSNPQFAEVSFDPDNGTGIITTTSVNQEIAPGWFLIGTGTGSPAYSVSRIALTSTTTTISNAPYALTITTSGGWTSLVLEQRFYQDGNIWAGTAVSGTFELESISYPAVSMQLLQSDSSTPTTVIVSDPLTSGGFVSFYGTVVLPAASNTDVPPDAYTSLQIMLAANGTLSITSIQLIGNADPLVAAVSYEQTTTNRQIDQLFHYYRDSIILQPKNTLLAGWNFPLNPWQFTTTSLTNVATNQYTADQTIVIQQNYVASNVGNNVSVGQSSSTDNYGFKVTAVTTTNQFALLQYIDAATIRPYWGYNLSALLKIRYQNNNSNTGLKVKMKLIYNTSVPSSTTRVYPVSAWTALGEPVFDNAFTVLTPLNDPSYDISTDSTFVSLSFDKFTLPTNSLGATATIGLFIYTTKSMISTGTADFIVIEDCSLVPNDFAMASNVLTFDETLARCQYFYQKSFPHGTLPVQNVGDTLGAAIGIQVSPASTAGAVGPIANFIIPMLQTPSITLYNPAAANGEIRNVSGNVDWVSSTANNISINGFYAVGSTNLFSTSGDLSAVHWTAISRIGG